MGRLTIQSDPLYYLACAVLSAALFGALNFVGRRFGRWGKRIEKVGFLEVGWLWGWSMHRRMARLEDPEWLLYPLLIVLLPALFWFVEWTLKTGPTGRTKDIFKKSGKL